MKKYSIFFYLWFIHCCSFDQYGLKSLCDEGLTMINAYDQLIMIFSQGYKLLQNGTWIIIKSDNYLMPLKNDEFLLVKDGVRKIFKKKQM